MKRFVLLLSMLAILLLPTFSLADQRTDPREQAISDTLDLWRDGSFEKLYDQLSHRSGMTRESFVSQMRDLGSVRPSCCHQKLRDFRLISEKRTTAKVYARIGMDGTNVINDTRSRDFTLDHEEGRWKMRLADIKSLAGLSKKKARSAKYYHK